MKRIGWLVAWLVALVPAVAHAGGVGRPNSISAHGVAMGGVFVPIADDATALHFDPAGLAFATPSLHLGGELVIAPRTYTPVDASGTRGAPQSPTTPVIPAPAIGVFGRVGERGTLGAGVWNTYGGQLSYAPTGRPAIDKTSELLIEVVAGGAYRVTPRFSVGGALRVGIGVFQVSATDMPVTSDLSGAGAGLGATLGVMWRPVDRITVGGVWHSGLSVDATGSGTIDLPGQGQLAVDFSHLQPWPQSAAIGLACAVGRLTIGGQVDWTQWSRWERLVIEFPGNEGANQDLPLDWHDSYTLRGGGEWRVGHRLALRAGLYFDTNAVPDHTIQRQYLDADKFGGSLGAGLALGVWRVDTAVDVAGGPARTVPDNSSQVGAFGDLTNLAPGDHQGTLYSVELALSRAL